MSQKVFVPYIYLIGYAVFIIIATLLVGLLPPLVNRPICAADGKPSSKLLDEPQPLSIAREKKVAAEVPRDVYVEKMNYFKDNLEKELSRNAFFQKRAAKGLKKAATDRCPEITNPQPGVTYPWNNPRLPTTLKPTNYAIEIVINDDPSPSSKIGTYLGDIVMTLDVTQSTNYILLHTSENDIPFVTSLNDRLGNDVPISCSSEFAKEKLDYFVIKTEQNLNPANGPYRLELIFIDINANTESGIFRLYYEKDKFMIASKFQPVDARKAYPIFDEPGFKATYDVRIYHKNDFFVLSNTPIKTFNFTSEIEGTSVTEFQRTPPMPSYMMAFLSFSRNDFDRVGIDVNTPNGPIPVTLWARKQFIQNGFTKDPLDYAERVLDGVLDVFREVNPAAIPPKIDIFAIPDYPVDAIAHFGLPVIKETRLLFKGSTASERDKQSVALLLAKTFAQFWLGNFVTQSWWDELWLSEGFSDYVKYRIVEGFFVEFTILTEFISEELVPTLILDGYPSSHPIIKPIINAYDIEEFFDEIESSKSAAILRWVETEFNLLKMYQAITAFLNANPWGLADVNAFYNALGNIGPKNWPAKAFFDRWTLQQNFPLLNIELVSSTTPQQLRFTQSRAINRNDSMFGGTQPYPSPFGNVWYILTTCEVGVGINTADAFRVVEFYIDQTTESFNLPNAPNGQRWAWVNCDKEFAGFYEAQYSAENWRLLISAIKNKNLNFDPEDRANIIHNAFLNAYAERGDYFIVRDVLDYLEVERQYVPWRTAYVHLMQIAPILEYRQSFFELSAFVSFVVRFVEKDIDIWTPGPADAHLENLLKETIVSLACYFQDPICIQKTADLWGDVRKGLQSGNFESTGVAAYVREIVYNYHVQNTYDLSDWDQIFFDFENVLDEAEQRKLLEALTYARLPWVLARLERDERFASKVNFFELNTLLAANTVGREIAWDYFRLNYDKIIQEYTKDDARIGKLLIEIARSFENEFVFVELLEWVLFLVDGAAANAGRKSLEIASTNVIWLLDKEDEIREAFTLNRLTATTPNVNPFLNPYVGNKDAFVKKARDMLATKLQQTPANSFVELKQMLIQ